MEDTDLQARLKQKLATYKPSDATIQLVRSTPILLLVGISGAGKDSITKALFATQNYHLLVSHTTRRPRENDGVMERDGVEYHFITLAEAERMVDAGAYVEANLFGGNVYGTSAAEIEMARDAHKIAVTDLEVQGVADYMRIDPENTKAVFVLPPNYTVWQERLTKRYGATIDRNDLDKRMSRALEELEHALQTPYFSFIVNDVLADAVEETDRIAHGQPEADKTTAQDVARELIANLRKDLAAAPTAGA